MNAHYSPRKISNGRDDDGSRAEAAEPAFHLGGQEGVVQDDRTAEDCKKEVLQKFLFSNLPSKRGERVVVGTMRF